MSPERATAAVVFCVCSGFATAARSIELQLFTLPSITWIESGASEPCWSPDGQYIAYIGDFQPDPTRYYGSMLRAANFRVEYLAWLPGGWEDRIWSLYGISSPTWSPDGKRIAYFLDFGSGEPAGIWTVGESSAPALLLSSAGGGRMACAWSPAGDAIAFVGQGSLSLITLDNLSVRPLTTGVESKPSWSPEGRSLVFASMRSGNRDLWVLDVESTAVRQLTTHAASDGNPAWSPNGRWIAFSSNRAGHSDLWVIPASGGAEIQLTDDEPWDDQPAWSPSGDRIAFVSSASRDDPDPVRWQAQIWIASQLPDVLTDVAARRWSTVKNSYR